MQREVRESEKLEKKERERGGNVQIGFQPSPQFKRLEHAIIRESKDKILQQPPIK